MPYHPIPRQEATPGSTPSPAPKSFLQFLHSSQEGIAGERSRSRTPNLPGKSRPHGSHLESIRRGSTKGPQDTRTVQAPKAQAAPRPKAQERKRQQQGDLNPVGRAGTGPPKHHKPKITKNLEVQPPTKEASDQRKALERDGFHQIFRKHLRDTPEEVPGLAEAPGLTAPSTFNRFEALGTSEGAEEVASKADQDQEDSIRDGWDQESRLEDLAHRKSDWHAAKIRKLSTRRTGSTRASASAPTGSGPQGSEGAGWLDQQSSSGSGARATKGPEAAGGPGSTEPPSAKKGGDREERAAPPGRLVSGVGRQAGLPEPFAAPTVPGHSSVGRFSAGTADGVLQAGAMPPASYSTHLSTGSSGRDDVRLEFDFG
jgi:hypothetical protein